MQLTRLLLLGPIALAGCDFTPELASDPAYWDPPPGPGPADGAPAEPGDAMPPGPACLEEPPYDAALVASSAGAASHRAGEPCLEACHEAGGGARATFAAAGTVYESHASRQPADAGSVHGIGGTTLPVDRCGNFYAAPSALETEVRFTQPFVQNPTFHRMDKSLFREKRGGSCNQSDCHDFSGKLRWGIYF